MKDTGIAGLDSLNGLKVGVEAGGFPVGFLKKYEQIHVVVLPSWASAFEQLDAGEIDAVFVDRWVGEYELYKRKLNNITLVDPPVVTLESRIAVKKGNTALMGKINAGLQGIARDGTRQSILDKWQAKEVVYLTRESIDRIVFAATGVAAVLLLGVAAYLYRQRRRLLSANSALEASIIQRTISMQLAQQAQAETTQISAEQKAILDNSVVGIVKVKDRYIIWANPAFLAMFGYTVYEATDLPTRTLFVDDHAYETFDRELRAAIGDGRIFSSEVMQRRKDGSAGWFSLNVAVLSAGGSVLIGSIIDITQRKREEVVAQI